MTCNEPLLYVLIFKFSLGLLNLGINTYTSTILKFLNTGVIFNLGKLLLNAERKEKYRMRKNAKVIPSSEKRRKKKQKLMQWLENFIIFSLNCPLNILWPSRTVVKKFLIKKNGWCNTTHPVRQTTLPPILPKIWNKEGKSPKDSLLGMKINHDRSGRL